MITIRTIIKRLIIDHNLTKTRSMRITSHSVEGVLQRKTWRQRSTTFGETLESIHLSFKAICSSLKSSKKRLLLFAPIHKSKDWSIVRIKTWLQEKHSLKTRAKLTLQSIKWMQLLTLSTRWISLSMTMRWLRGLKTWISLKRWVVATLMIKMSKRSLSQSSLAPKRLSFLRLSEL